MKKNLIFLFSVLALIAGCDSNVEPDGPDNQGGTPTVPSEPNDGKDQEPDTEKYALFRIPEAEEELGVLAFPGAEGGGMYVTGGRGGKVIHVTNLNDSGTGSLRDAVSQSGARTIVFDVAGIIHLTSRLDIKNGNLTIAGQTAPGDGICIADNTVRIAEGADNIIIRFLRFRLGDEGIGLSDGSDAIWGRYASNIIIDHCSMSWSVDEVGSFYANKNFTLQWSILSEALTFSGVHSKGVHGYGGIWGGRNASFHHNLLADNYSRNARIDHPGIYLQDGGATDYRTTHRGNVDYRNNVIYNWGDNSTYGGEDGHFNMVGNYYKPGPASKDRKYYLDAYWYNSSSKIGSAYPVLYMEDNYHTSGVNSNYPNGVYFHSQGNNPDHVFVDEPLSIKADDSKTCYTTTHPVQTSFTKVLDYAGASLARDAVDTRVTGDAKTGTATYPVGTTASSSAAGSTTSGGLIDSQSVVGGWPEYSATDAQMSELADTDGDGLPDYFETEFGLDPSDASDASAKTLDIHGRYTNFEMYLHWLVRDIVAGQISGGTYTALD